MLFIIIGLVILIVAILLVKEGKPSKDDKSFNNLKN